MVSFTPTTVTNPIGVQGAYPFTMVPSNEGMLGDINDYQQFTGSNETGAALPFGALVQADPTGGRSADAARLAINGNALLGILIDSFTFEGVSANNSSYLSNGIPGTNLAADGRTGYPNTKSLNILRRGVIWVYSAEAVGMADPVRFFGVTHHSVLPGAHVGRFGKTAVPNKTFLFTSGAKWLSRTTGPGLALLDISAAAFGTTADVP